MNELERDLSQFVLVFLNSPDFNGRAVATTAIRRSLRSAHPHLAFTDGQIDRLIAFLEKEQFITGTVDSFDGPVWVLTQKGKIRAQ